MPTFTAKLSFAKMTPRKMRYMADLIRGRNVNVALSMLRVQDKRSGRYFFKLLKSAIAIAAQNSEIDTDMLFVKEVRVDPGPMMKRWRSAPMGRALPIKKRFSHAIIVLEAAEEKIEQKPRISKAKPKPADAPGGKAPVVAPKKEETQPKQQVAESDKK